MKRKKHKLIKSCFNYIYIGKFLMEEMPWKKIEMAVQSNEPKIIEKQVIIDNVSQNCTRNRNRKSGETDNGTVLLGGLVLIFAVGVYVQYRWQILLGFIVISLLIELLTCTIYYKGKKNGILYDKNLQQIGG